MKWCLWWNTSFIRMKTHISSSNYYHFIHTTIKAHNSHQLESCTIFTLELKDCSHLYTFARCLNTLVACILKLIPHSLYFSSLTDLIEVLLISSPRRRRSPRVINDLSNCVRKEFTWMLLNLKSINHVESTKIEVNIVHFLKDVICLGLSQIYYCVGFLYNYI